jgi:uncharacterized protein (TIGR02246 family)
MNRDEQEIRELVITWMEATKRGDLPKVLSLMAEDVVFLVPGQTPMIGRAAFEAASKAHAADGGGPTFDGTSVIEEIKVLGDWAYMWTRLRVVTTFPDGRPPMARAGHTMSILRKENGKWVLARDANMLAPERKDQQ